MKFKIFYENDIPTNNINDNFHKWFDGSKILDSNGNPLILYHGTDDTFDEFILDHENKKDVGWLGYGIYLTNSKPIAKMYSISNNSKDAKIMELYVNMKNPYYVKDAHKQKSYIKGIQDTKGRDAAIKAIKDLTDMAIKKGHDGVIATTFPNTTAESIEYVVFDPTNIKSVNNNGDWSTINPNIYK